MENIQVAVRLRPLNDKEQLAGEFVPWRVRQNTIEINRVEADAIAGKKQQKHNFVFDHCFNENHSNEVVYAKVAKGVVHSCLEGYNATIFMYGQTGSGKTYTMLGYDKTKGLYNQPEETPDIKKNLPCDPLCISFDHDPTMGIEDFSNKYPDFVFDSKKEDFESNTGILIQSLKDIFSMIEKVDLHDLGHRAYLLPQVQLFRDIQRPDLRFA